MSVSTDKVVRFLIAIALLGGGFFLSEEAAAQHFPALQFDHLAVKDGLSNNVVRCVSQDKQGFIWIGTANGLNRYDGYRFKQYFHNNADSNSLINNTIQNLYCDSKGRLWINTDGGASCFLPDRNIFINYSAKLTGPRRLVNNNAATVFEDGNKNVWILNQGNSIFRVKENMELQQVSIGAPAFSFQHAKKEGYAGLFKDHVGNEWAFCACRIYLLDKNSKQPLKIFDFDGETNTEILKMTEDGAGNYWIATWGDGLMKFSPAANKLEPIKSVTGFSIIDLLSWQYENKHWMLAIDAKDGLYIINPENTSVLNVKANNNDPYTIEDGDLFSAFTGANGSLWIATDKGVNVLNYKEKVFDVYPVTDTGTINYDPGQTNMVIAYFEDDDGMWLAKRYRSTFLYDSVMHIKKYISNVSRFNSDVFGSAYFSYRLGSPYCFYKTDTELFLTTDSGLVVSDKQLRQPRLYFPSAFSAAADLREMVALTDETLLIRSYRNGLFVFNTRSKKYVTYFNNKEACASCVPFLSNYLFKTRTGAIYVTCNAEKNLLTYDASKNIFSSIRPVNAAQFNFGQVDLYGMAEDHAGKLWIASANGIFVYDPATNKIENNFTENGKMGRTRRICFDNYGNVWTNGYSGIWFYAIATRQWINFTSIDGLPGGNNDGALERKKNGDILVGLEGSIAVFHPGKLMNAKTDTQGIITEAEIAGQYITFPLFAAAGKKLNVPAGKGFFSVDFALLNYSNRASNGYYFKLAPVMKDFQLNENGHINFNGLSPGHYTLYARGGDKVGNISSREDTLDIYVEPAWYQANWFKTLFVLHDKIFNAV